MKTIKYKSYHLGKPTLHKINVWDAGAEHLYLYMSCNMCKYKNYCLDKKHKQEDCFVVPKLDAIFSEFLIGRVSSFLSDEFYIDQKYNKLLYINQFKKAIKKIGKQFIKKENVRD